MTRMIALPLLFALIAYCEAAPINAPPDCPQLLADAQQAIKDCDVQIDAAVQKLNVTSQELDHAVDDAAALKVRTSNTLNTAVNRENIDKSVLSNDQAHLQDAKNNLTNIENNCKSPAPPPNCGQLESEAEQTIAAWRNVVDQDEATIQNDDAIVAFDTQQLQSASNKYDIAVANRTTVMAELRDNLQNATDAKDAALKHYQEIEQECQMFVADENSNELVGVPPDCPKLVHDAEQTLQDCDTKLNNATQTYNEETKRLSDIVDDAQSRINTLQGQINSDTNIDNHDKTILLNDQATLQNAQNNVKNWERSCSAPVPPTDCAQQLDKARNDLKKAQAAVDNDTTIVFNDDQKIAQDKMAYSRAQKEYQDAVDNLNATRDQLKQDIDALTIAKDQAQINYEIVQKECQI